MSVLSVYSWSLVNCSIVGWVKGEPIPSRKSETLMVIENL